LFVDGMRVSAKKGASTGLYHTSCLWHRKLTSMQTVHRQEGYSGIKAAVLAECAQPGHSKQAACCSTATCRR
jgi:hypothetical protein